MYAIAERGGEITAEMSPGRAGNNSEVCRTGSVAESLPRRRQGDTAQQNPVIVQIMGERIEDGAAVTGAGADQ